MGLWVYVLQGPRSTADTLPRTPIYVHGLDTTWNVKRPSIDYFSRGDREKALKALYNSRMVIVSSVVTMIIRQLQL